MRFMCTASDAKNGAAVSQIRVGKFGKPQAMLRRILSGTTFNANCDMGVLSAPYSEGVCIRQETLPSVSLREEKDGV